MTAATGRLYSHSVLKSDRRQNRLKLVFTVDGDWEEYYDPDLSEQKRKPDKAKMLTWIDKETGIAVKMLGGRLLHFIHTSPMAREFFMQPEFISRYKAMEKAGGNVGIHCHEDEPRRAYYYDDVQRMDRAISSMVAGLRGNGLSPVAFRAGYLAFSPTTIPLLEKNGIFLDLSCDPGRHLFHGDLLVSDWRGAPDNYYRLDYSDHRRAGKSRVFEIPLGFYIEKESLFKIWQKAKKLAASPENTVVSVLTHSYEFGSFTKRQKIKIALLILSRYGKFVNGAEVADIIKEVEEP